MKKPSAFTLIELLIVLVVVGILSTVLFRTVSDVISLTGRIQLEKKMSNELMTIQTVINHLAEQYPYLEEPTTTDGWTDTITLFKDQDNTVTLWFEDENNPLNPNNKIKRLYYEINRDGTKNYITSDTVTFFNPKFKVLSTLSNAQNNNPVNYLTTASHPWFWIVGELTNVLPDTPSNLSTSSASNSSTTNNPPKKSSYLIQHFVNLRIPHKY